MNLYVVDDELYFPPVEDAIEDGILAIDGDLSTERLMLAYRSGIFPWFSEGQPVIWWAPDPRFILFPEALKVSKSMKQLLRKKTFKVTIDTVFEEVIRNCQQSPREGQDGTWITEDMIEAYKALHQKGFAHSVEVWQEEKLVGGLYGISMGSAFFGESMFMKVSNASKYGFITLVQALQNLGFDLIDCQVHTPHLESLGAIEIPRVDFMQKLNNSLQNPTIEGSWSNLFDQ